MRLTQWLLGASRERLAQRVSAASYGTILVLGVLVFLNADQVSSGLGWELITGVGVATYVAHLYAEVVGDHVLTPEPLDRSELRRAMTDGLPILAAAVPPAALLGLGRTGLLEPETALSAAVLVGLIQLIGLGALVGTVAHAPSGAGRTWSYAILTLLIGLVVVALRVGLKH